MASALAHRPANAGAAASSSSQTIHRSPSFSSFPSSRSPSSLSSRPGARPARSPQPPAVRESDASSTSASVRPSQRSSMSGGPVAVSALSNQHHHRPHQRPRRLRSQYPSDSSENHVEYILVAAFDIDRGSVMEHQYPGPISGDEHMLAELMLPDQAHVRSQDWTVFFLHKDTTAEDEAKEERRERRRRRRRRRKAEGENGETTAGAETDGTDTEDTDESGDYSGSDTEEEDGGEGFEGPPLIYVLNLVNTKQDQSVKRGAIVKAMAICTRHSFLHIYKPLLLLALEEYFRAPIPETLASLYNALNAMDLSLMPRLSLLERWCLQASDAKDMFIEKFEQMIQQRMLEDARHYSDGSDPSTPSPLKKGKHSLPRDTHEFESKVIYNGIPIPIKVPTAISPESVGDFSLIKLIQTFSNPHTTTPQPFALHPHLTTNGAFTHPIIVLVNALLTQKRIIFIGNNRPSSEVAEAVLAACALASGGLLRGFTRHAFPYTDLTKIDDLLKVPGFIAGVTNPVFGQHAEWWDLLCDLTTGRMKISNRIESAAVTDGLVFFQQLQDKPNLNSGAAVMGAMSGATSGTNSGADATGDHVFMDALLASIANRHGEGAIRQKWRDWVQKFTRIAAAFEECVYGASALYIGSHETDAGAFGVTGHGYVWPDEVSRMRELAANVHRVEGWRITRSYYSYVQDLAHIWTKRPVRGLDFLHQHDRLRMLKLNHEQSAAIYLAFGRAVEQAGGITDGSPPITPAQEQALLKHSPNPELQYDTILQLLNVLPESNSGLFYISLGLFHPKPEVRLYLVKLLDKIREHPAGRHFWSSLGRFAKLAYYRVKREEEVALGR